LTKWRRRSRQRRRPDTESKTRTPHKDVGEKTTILAPVMEKQWVGILIQGVRGAAVHAETFWSIDVSFEEPREGLLDLWMSTC